MHMHTYTIIYHEQNAMRILLIIHNVTLYNVIAIRHTYTALRKVLQVIASVSFQTISNQITNYFF